MATVRKCPSCNRSMRISGDGLDPGEVCPECLQPIPSESVERNPYAPPSAPPEPEAEIPELLPAGPTSVLQKYREGLRLLASHLGLFGSLVLTVWLPGNLLINYLAYHASNPSATMRLGGVIEGIFGPLYIGGMIHALSSIGNGRRVTYPEAIGAGFRSWGRLFGTRWFTGMIVLAGLIAFLIPGIVLLIRYALLDSVVVLEGESGSAARRRSSDLTRGRRWQILAAGLLYTLIMGLSYPGAGWLLAAYEPINSMWTSTVLDCALDLLMTIITIVMFLFYWEAAGREDVEGAGSSATHPAVQPA